MTDPQLFPDMIRSTDDPRLATLLAEANRAQGIYGPFRSTHEAYGVLAEEMMELLLAIHGNDIEAARKEAMQVAAVAYRFARDGVRRQESPASPTEPDQDDA